MHIIVKKSEPRVDPKRPETHPGYARAVEVSRRRAPKMEFESDGARMDYERQLRQNPNNLPGLPLFYPPLQLRSVTGDVWGHAYTEEEQRRMVEENCRLATIADINILCTTCNEVTPHSISMEGSFCKKCGSQKPYHH